MNYNVLESFFTLLRIGLWGGDPGEMHLSSDEWLELYALSRRQTVQGVMLDAILKLPPEAGFPAYLRERWTREQELLVARYDRIAGIVKIQEDAWRNRGINAVQIKGQTVAVMYPEPKHRLCGDIDWWMPTEDDWRRALAAVHENGCRTETDSDGDLHYVLGGIMVEHHRHGLEAEGPEGVMLMLNMHILHHVMVAGIGLRQICDLAMAYDFHKESIPAYRVLLKETGLEAWTEVLDELVTSLKVGEGPMALEGRAASLLDLVLEDGNFGLDKDFRFGGFHKRASLLLRLVPGRFVRTWAGLVRGRLRRFFGQSLS